MNIILIRHGESEHNSGITILKDTPLTKKGVVQAKFLGKKLKRQKIKINKIYTSNLIRSKQTGEIISKIIHIPIKSSLEELDEYASKNLKSRIRILFNLRLRKLKKFLKELSIDKERNKNILIIAHGVTNRIIMGYLLQIPLKKQLLRFRQHNTGLSVLYWNKNFKNWCLESMNDMPHLPKKLRSINKS
ncbi:MAG: histidine phosphatase family protein [Nanoarchaeota archaeon]|nr:histidine phosphatase family protein [Nanoarchaeota archaeon]